MKDPVPHDLFELLDRAKPEAQAFTNGVMVACHRAAGNRMDVVNGAAVASDVLVKDLGV